jgi:putative hydrolase of the HAD superfamily
MQIRAVAFDIDGTMYYNKDMYLRSLPFALKNWRLLDALRKARIQMRSLNPEGRFHDLQAELAAQHARMNADFCRKRIDAEVYGRWELSLRGIRLVPGFLDCARALKDRGLKLGVLSDFPVGRKLEVLDVPPLWEARLSTEDVGFLKPDPRGFLELASRLGVESNAILYVGNSYHYDVLGARSAGMMTAHFAPRPHKNSLADFTFWKYSELCAWILARLDQV